MTLVELLPTDACVGSVVLEAVGLFPLLTGGPAIGISIRLLHKVIEYANWLCQQTFTSVKAINSRF